MASLLNAADPPLPVNGSMPSAVADVSPPEFGFVPPGPPDPTVIAIEVVEAGKAMVPGGASPGARHSATVAQEPPCPPRTVLI